MLLSCSASFWNKKFNRIYLADWKKILLEVIKKKKQILRKWYWQLELTLTDEAGKEKR